MAMNYNIDSTIIEDILRPYNPIQSGNEYIIRCPICGDSKKNTKKRRFYMSHEGLGHCHNCGWSGNIIQFYMKIHNVSYSDAMLQIFGNEVLDFSFDTSILNTLNKTDYMPHKLSPMNISPLGEGIMSKRIKTWLTNRKLTPEYMKYNPQYMISMEEDTFGWLVIPIFFKGEIVEIQMRNIVQKNFKTYKHKNNDFVIYNYDWLDFNKPIIIYEGPYDAMFTENSTCQFGVMKSKEPFIQYFLDKQCDIIFMFDNDQPGYDGLSKLYNTYGNKFKAFVWDYSLKKYKDINDAIKDGMKINYKYIIDNSFVLSDAIGLNQINVL